MTTMHSKLEGIEAKEPRNRVNCGFRVNLDTDSSTPVQLKLLAGAFKTQTIYFTKEDAERLMNEIEDVLTWYNSEA